VSFLESCLSKDCRWLLSNYKMRKVNDNGQLERKSRHKKHLKGVVVELCSAVSLLPCIFGVSQNDSLVEVGRDLWRSTCPTSSAQARPPRASCPGLHAGLSQGWRLHHLSAQPVFGHPLAVKVFQAQK